VIKHYQIHDYDTMQQIAQLFYNNPARWMEIASYNSLDYPYLTTDQNYQRDFPATGVVTFTADSVVQDDRTIPKDTLVWVAAANKDITYFVKFDTILPAGSASVDVEIQCSYPGSNGNNRAFAIDSTDLSGFSVTNKDPFTNGLSLNVKKTGEYIMIPIDVVPDEIVYTAKDANYLDLLGGEDFVLNDFYDFVTDAYGDLGSVKGLGNIAQAIKHRLETERGDLPYHPEYGSRLYQLIGRREPFIHKMVGLEIMETTLQDERVENVEINSVTVNQGIIYVDMNVQLIGQTAPQTLRMALFEGGQS
jgi:phage baseplate assembly protein W